MITIEFGEYTPDQSPLANQGLTVASNCLPYSNYYDSLQALSAYSGSTLSGPCKGMFSTRSNDGTSFTFAGDSTKLYKFDLETDTSGTVSTTFVDVSRLVGGAYAVPSDGQWEFAKWGERVLACNYANDIQTFTMGTSSNFAALAGTPPKAAHMAVVRDFLVCGQVTGRTDTASNAPSRVQWCAFNNIESWAPDVDTQADFQDLQGDGGYIQKVVGGDYGLIFQERSLWRMSYIGGRLIFQFDEIEKDKGTPAPNSVVQKGEDVFYLGHDDFYKFSGGRSHPIGAERIWKTFTDDYDAGLPDKVWGEYDPIRPFIFWVYPSKNATDNPDKAMIYNWLVDKWAGPISVETQVLGQYQSRGYTLEELDAFTNASGMESLAYSLDSRVWQGKTLNFAAFGSDNGMKLFTGNELTATFETGGRQLFADSRASVINTRPIVEGFSASMAVAVSGRSRLEQTASYGSLVSMNIDGECPQIKEGRYHRFKVEVKNGFSNAQGLQVEAVKRGRY